MMKSSKPVIIVDSVENAIKFYTEKLGFDIVDLHLNKEENNTTLSFAHLKKGKAFIIFKLPKVEELAEFSFIKRCASRCVGVFIDMKKGLDKYYDKCNKKGLNIIEELKECGPYKMFSIKDPFGIKLTFAELIREEKHEDFAGLKVNQTAPEKQSIEEMVKYLKGFGILRRAAKKYAKFWLKTAKK